MDHTDPTIVEFLGLASVDDTQLVKFTIESDEQMARRFIDARAGDVTKALQLMHECGEVKRAHNITHLKTLAPGDILHVDIAVLKHFYPHGDIGHDKCHRPLFFEHSGAVNIDAVLHMVTLEQLKAYHLWNMEVNVNRALVDKLNLIGSQLSSVKIVVISDLSEMTMAHCSSKFIEHFKAIIALDNVCYPETLGSMFIINSPKIAIGAYKLLKGFADKKTQKKVEMFGKGGVAAPRLLEVIDADQLPVSMGGSGLEPYSKKPHTAFVKVGSRGTCVYSISLPRQSTLLIDSYIKSSPMELSVVYGKEPPVEALRVILQPSAGGLPTRCVHTVDSSEYDRMITVHWTNLETRQSRHLVYSLSVSSSTSTGLA
jgi:hypothetical protein